MLDTALSLKAAKQIRGAPKGRCYENAVRAMCAGIPELDGAIYCEGWAVLNLSERCGAWIPHGWLELTGGRIVDPTLAEEASNHTAVAKFSVSELATALGRHYPITLGLIDGTLRPPANGLLTDC